MNNYSKYRRETGIQNNAVENELVTRLMAINHHWLYPRLVKTEEDKDIFQDTFLKMTVTYKRNTNFVKEFIDTFYEIREEFRRDDRSNLFLPIMEGYVTETTYSFDGEEQMEQYSVRSISSDY